MSHPAAAAALAALQTRIGQEVQVSDWLPIMQERVDAFAEATGDHQWIHVDAERARRESPFGGPIAHVRDGDRIRIDGQAARLDVLMDEATWAKRQAQAVKPPAEHLSGVLEKYAKLVSPARLGAVTHSGPPKQPS